MTNQETKRERSAVYPYASWNDCVDFIKEVDSFRASQVSYDEVAKKSGVGIGAPSFKARLSTSRQFGLIDTVSNVISLTSSAKRLLYPTGNNKHEIIFESFVKPPLYSKLVELYNGKALPTEMVLGNVLMNDHRIARNAKDTAAKFFLLNANEMGFVRAGVLDYSLIVNENIPNDVTETPEVIVEEKPANVISIPPIEPVAQISTGSENDYITHSSGKVKIIIPLDTTEDDLWVIRDWLDSVMKRKFKINLE